MCICVAAKRKVGAELPSVSEAEPFFRNTDRSKPGIGKDTRVVTNGRDKHGNRNPKVHSAHCSHAMQYAPGHVPTNMPAWWRPHFAIVARCVVLRRHVCMSLYVYVCYDV